MNGPRRLWTGLVALALVVALVVVAVAGGFLASPFDVPPAENASADGPGSRFAGVVGVQGSEVRGELDEASLTTRIAAAENDTARAEVVAAETAAVEERLTVLEQQRAAHADDSESRLASTATEALTLERQVDRLEAVAATLPPETVSAAGVEDGTFDSLRERARALADEDALAAARDVAGPDAGEEYDDDADDDDVGDDDDGDDSDTDESDGADSDDDTDETDDGDDTDDDDTDSDDADDDRDDD